MSKEYCRGMCMRLIVLFPGEMQKSEPGVKLTHLGEGAWFAGNDELCALLNSLLCWLVMTLCCWTASTQGRIS